MRPLSTNQRMLKWLCVCPLEARDSQWMKPLCIIFSLITFAAVAGCVLSSIVFFSTNISTDLEESLYALFQISAFSGVAYMAIVAFIERNKITAFLETLTKIYNTRKRIIDFCRKNEKKNIFWTGNSDKSWFSNTFRC